VVPQLVNFSGRAMDSAGKPLAGIAGATFAIYAEQSGGAPLWMETQNIQADAKGNYSVQLGATSAEGLPLELFASGQARWLGVRVNGDEEQPRILLLSVPYALKAADAQTLGGLPASAFLLAGAANAAAAQSIIPASSPSSAPPPSSSNVTTSGGTVNTLPLFNAATNIQSSILTQSGSGSAGKIGINTTSPATTLDVNGGETVRGALALPVAGAASATAGKNSQPTTMTASSYNSSSKAAVPQTFQLQAEPAGNDTATPSGTLNLLYASGTATPAETGLKISNKGLITFATGQPFPTVTGNETVTGNVSASQLISTIPTGTAPLKVTSTTEVVNLNASLLGGKAASAFAQLAAPNTFTANQTVTGNLSATGVVAGGSFEIGTNLFAFGSFKNTNAFLGFSGNTTMTGTGNTAAGASALQSNTSGFGNTAAGWLSLFNNTVGCCNTATGQSALQGIQGQGTGSGNTAIGYTTLSVNSLGNNNTATGQAALSSNTTGSFNTAAGSGAGLAKDNTPVTGSNNTFLGNNAEMSTGGLSNATAIGANAYVAANNTLALGSIAGVNGATSSTNVGIGTPAPTHELEVNVGGATVAQTAVISTGSDAALSLKNTGSGGREYWIDSGSSGAGIGSGNFAIWDATAASPRLTIDSAGNASQQPTAGGLVKAMLYVNGDSAPYNIVRCFNSTLSGPAATTPPCGITFNEEELGIWGFTFNFEVDNRFASATLDYPSNSSPPGVIRLGYGVDGPDNLWVFTSPNAGDNLNFTGTNANFTLVVF
jgi:hypothetical protein